MADNSIKITLPKGTLVYPALQRPDTKYNDLGDYKADVRMSKEAAEPVIKKLQERAKAHIGKPFKVGAKGTPWKIDTDDEGNPTGDVVFTIRAKNKQKKDGSLWDRRPALIGADKMPVDVNPWGGTIARVQFETYEWFGKDGKGIALQPVVVQIIDLVTGEGREADLSDFDEEDGFTGGPDTSDFDTDDESGADTGGDEADEDY